MRRLVELMEEETTLASEIYKMMVGHPEVQNVHRKRGFIDLRITTEHWCKIMNLLIDNYEPKEAKHDKQSGEK